LEFMNKDWDAPWKYGFAEHGFTDGGERHPAPSFTSSRNPTCQACGLRQRTWKGGPGKCECDEPEFDSAQQTVSDRQKFQQWCVLWLTECYRVLSAGGILKVFGATRMNHRMCAAMEEAGFLLDPEHSLEAWAYGSGFPKALNTSKAIDKHLGKAGERPVTGRGKAGAAFHYGNPGGGGFGTLSGSQPGRSVASVSWDTTGPATPEATKFDGWATALKPGWEPFIVGRKEYPISTSHG